jgi:putative membrane protein
VKRVSLSVDTSTFTMQDWVGALSADPNPKDYAGKPVQISGIVLHSAASMPPGYIMVMRYQVTCCIADARPVGLIVKDTSHGALKDNQWVHVSGVMSSARYEGDSIAIVSPKVMKPIKASDPYMY